MEAAAVADPKPYPDSLCHTCVHLREVQGARSRFLLCAEGRPPKYPPQPVRGCPCFSAVAPATGA